MQGTLAPMALVCLMVAAVCVTLSIRGDQWTSPAAPVAPVLATSAAVPVLNAPDVATAASYARVSP